jgi:hypothetical protein
MTERLAGVVVRRVMHRTLETSMRELAAALETEFAQVNRPSSLAGAACPSSRGSGCSPRP